MELRSLSQRPELFKVAAIQNEVVNITDDQQTVVVTVGIDIRLDWSNWVADILTDSALNVTYTYYRTQLNSTIGLTEVLRQSERVVFETDEELKLFFVEISPIVSYSSRE